MEEGNGELAPETPGAWFAVPLRASPRHRIYAARPASGILGWELCRDDRGLAVVAQALCLAPGRSAERASCLWCPAFWASHLPPGVAGRCPCHRSRILAH